MSSTLIDEIQDGSEPPFMPITVHQFQQMFEKGILQDGDPVELIDGMLVRKDCGARGDKLMGHHPRHALLIMRLQRLLREACEAAGWHVRIQLPVVLNDINEPEPDIAVVHGTEEDYTDRHPGPEDVVLVIEVADSSLGMDRSTKQRLYATAGVARYWIINLPESQVEVLEQPDPASEKYVCPMIFTRGQAVLWSLSATRQIEINVADLFR